MRYVDAVIAGIVVGGAYSLLGVGISLIFSTSGVLNFAHAGFAMVAAYLYSWLGAEHDWAAWPAAFASVGAVTVLGVAVERLVIRRVATAPAVSRLMTTLGLLALLQGLTLQLFGFQPKAAKPLFPSGRVSIGSVDVTHQQLAVFVAAVGLVVALSLFLRLTRTGLAVRAASQNLTVARLMGIRRNQIAQLNWAVGALLAAVAGVLIAPLTIVTIGTFPLLMLKALAATLFGGVSGLVGSFAGGFVIGVVEAIAATASSTPGIRELVVLLVVLGLLVGRRRWPTDVTAVEVLTVGTHGSRYHVATRTVLGALVVLALVQAVQVDFWGYVGSLALVYVLVGLSLVVLTGWTGQVSLMHGAIVGLGAFGFTWYTNRLDFPFWAAVVAAALTGMVISGLVAFPALRLRGLQVGIATLAVSAAMSEWLFQFRGTSWTITRPDFFIQDRRIFYVLLPITAAAFVLVRQLRSGAWGRMFFAVRQSSETAAHFGINPVRVRVTAFLVSGFIAALAGAFYAVLLTAIKPSDFGVLLSISFLLYVVVGGVESMAGPVIAALVFAFGPQLSWVKQSQTTASALPDIVSGLLVIVLIAVRPGGLASFLGRPGHVAEEKPAERPLRPRPLARGEVRRLPRPAPAAADALPIGSADV